jgi:hypothetical protein
VATRTFDAWMIADEAAWGQVLGVPVNRSREPEKIRRPKRLAEQRRDSAGSDLGLRDCYAELAAVADLDVVARRCPNGFAPFAERVRGMRM